MSFICRMVVGYFEPAQAYGREIVTNRRLNLAMVGRLQAACDQLFGTELQLADHLADPGVLVVEDGVISREMFQLACVAHELFGMTAIDIAHRDVVYPRPDWEPESLDESMQSYREFRPDWDEAKVRQEAEIWNQWQVRQAAFERDAILRVNAAKQERHVERDAGDDRSLESR